jgi:hypothetical protein
MTANPTNPSGVSIALGRCRFVVICCCWIVGLALAAQMLVWSLATFTELRFEAAEEPGEAPLIVHAEPTTSTSNGAVVTRERRALPRPHSGTHGSDHAPDDQTLSRNLGANDHRFAATFDLAGGFGQCAMLLLLAIIGLTVMLAAASNISSVDRTVSSFLWLLLIALMVLPAGNLFSLPWQEGALATYEYMITHVDRLHEQRELRLAGAVSESGQPPISAVELYTRFGMLPAACIIGITLVGLRFCSSLEGAIPQREKLQLDPALEREAANITPTSLHGGRSSSVFNRAMRSTGEAIGANDKPVPSARSVSPGEQPKRLI